MSIGPDPALLQILVGIAGGEHLRSRHLHAADVEDVFAQTGASTHEDSGISAVSEGQPAAFSLNCRNNVPGQSGFIHVRLNNPLETRAAADLPDFRHPA